jgi:hypothetical protein
MAKPINPLVHRLGYSYFWKLRTGVFSSSESFKNQYILSHWLQNIFRKLNIYLLDLNSFENNWGVLYFNILCIFSSNIRKFNWISFSFIVRKWLNIWFFKQPWNKKHRMWVKNSKNIITHPFYKRLKQKRLFLFFFYKLFFYKITWLFNTLFKKLIIFNIKNIRFFFNLNNDSFINMIANTIVIKTGLLKRKNYKWIDNFLWFLTLSFFLKNAKLFGTLLAFEIEKNRQHNKTLRFVTSMISLIVQRTFNCLFHTLLFQIKGKINAVDRKIKRTFRFGKGVPFQTKRLFLQFALVEAFTYTGVISIKIWLY